MKYLKFLTIVSPALFAVCFLYLSFWLDLFNALPYLCMFLFIAALTAAQWLVKSPRVRRVLTLVKYVPMLLVGGFYAFMYMIVGPAGNDVLLTGFILCSFLAAASTVPLCVLELKYLWAKIRNTSVRDDQSGES